MHDFEDIPDGEHVFMGNAGVMGKRKVLFKFTSGKSSYLNNVLFVPSLRRNLVSGSLLDIVGSEVNQKGGKIVILRDGVFVGKGYRNGELFVLNVVFDAVNKDASTSALLSLWICDMVDLDMSTMPQ